LSISKYIIDNFEYF